MGRAVRAGVKACTTTVFTLVLVVQAFPPARGLEADALRRGAPKLQWSEGGRPAVAQQPAPANPLAPYIKVQAPVIALTHVRVIDGTGAPARDDQTIVIRDGNIAAIGDAARVAVPADATVIDGTGKSVVPGLVMMHEHLYYTTGPGVYGQLGVSFSRLYLAGGVTTMRTAGNLNGIMDINLARRIAAGEMPGPYIDATAPYVNGPNAFLQMHAVESANQARTHVQYWQEQGSTSVKAYMQISRASLKGAIDEAHKRGLKITGHLCSVTYGEAADLGIDNLEHGFFAATDFVADKQPDVCPGQGRGQQTIAALDENGEPFKALVKKLVDKHVALTSTLTVFETFTPGRPLPPGLDVLTPQLKASFERAFAKAGGLLIAGTDPTGAGGVVPGYADQRQVELLVEEGFTPVEAISIATLNGAKYLGRDAKIGSIAVGKQADLVLVDGNPAATIGDIRKVDTVFRQGIGFDPAKLIESVKGQVGIW